MKQHLITILVLAFAFISCTPKNAGQVTLINSGVESVRITVDDRLFKLPPANHISKDLSEGPHKIEVDGGPPINVNIIKDRTTVFDSTGLSCFVVVDFTDKLTGGPLKVTERFIHQQIFTTSGKMAVMLGNPLPKKLIANERLIRLHQVDCEIAKDDAAISMELANTF